MKPIKLSDLKAAAVHKPQGYYDDVVSKGTIDGEYLLIDVYQYKLLRLKYSNPMSVPKAFTSQSFVPNTSGCCGSKKMPPITEQAKNLANSALTVASATFAGRSPIATDEVAKERLGICEQCEFYDKEKQRCSKCGCFMKIKAKLAPMKCPIGKW